MKRRQFLGATVAAVGGIAAGAGGTLGAQALINRPIVYPTDGAPSAQSYLPIDPANITRAVGKLDSLVTDLMKRTGMPGVAVAVVHDDAIVYTKGFGVRKVGTTDRVDADSVFQLASLSKSVSATAISGAVAAGVAQWGDPIVKHLPNFTLHDEYATANVTIADMFSHRSGLPGHAGDLIEDLGFDAAAIQQRLKYYELAPIRTQYEYTNFGLEAGAEAIARAAGTSWEDVVQKYVFRPLGMTSASTTYSAYANSPQRSFGHIRVGDTWEASVTRNADAQSAAGGVSSSVTDMAKWMRLQLAEGTFDGVEVVPQLQLRQMQTPHAISEPARTPQSRSGLYGLGMGLSTDVSGRATFSHSGAFSTGAGTNYVMMPAENLGIVILGNGMAIGLAEAVSKSFYDIVTTGAVQADWYSIFNTNLFAPGYVNPGQLNGLTRPPQPAAPSGALPTGIELAGTYANDLYGPARVSGSGNGLTLSLGPSLTPFPLTSWDGLIYSYLPTGENAVGISAVTFTLNAVGTAATMTVENLNGTDKVTPLGIFTHT